MTSTLRHGLAALVLALTPVSAQQPNQSADRLEALTTPTYAATPQMNFWAQDGTLVRESTQPNGYTFTLVSYANGSVEMFANGLGVANIGKDNDTLELRNALGDILVRHEQDREIAEGINRLSGSLEQSKGPLDQMSKTVTEESHKIMPYLLPNSNFPKNK